MKVGDDEDVIKNMPWSVILLVSGVTLLVEVMKLTGGINLAVNAIAAISNQVLLIPVITFFGSLVGAFTSNMGVVLPTFIPMLIPASEAVGGVNIPDLATAFAVATSLGDVSPLSVIGAIAVASATASMNKTKMFRDMTIYGLGITVVGTMITWLLVITIH